MYWKSFFIFISDKLINELSDFEYQKRYKVAKATESVDLANCILLDDERILSSHSDSFLRLWSSSDGECFMNWFSLIFDSSSYKHGWWMLKWKFVCPPFCHFFFWQIYKCQKNFHFGFGNFHVFVKKKKIMPKTKWSFTIIWHFVVDFSHHNLFFWNHSVQS